MQITRLTKNLIVASSTGVASFSSGGQAVTIQLSTFDTPRRITVWGASIINGNVLITGTNEYGQTITETINASTVAGTVTTTLQDFLTLASIVTNSTTISSTGNYVGTSSMGGTPWVLIDKTKLSNSINFQLVPTSTTVQVSFEYTFDDISYPWTNLTSTGTRNTSPFPTVSSLGSAVTAVTQNTLNFLPNAWRITLASSATLAGSAVATVIQSG